MPSASPHEAEQPEAQQSQAAGLRRLLARPRPGAAARRLVGTAAGLESAGGDEYHRVENGIGHVGDPELDEVLLAGNDIGDEGEHDGQAVDFRIDRSAVRRIVAEELTVLRVVAVCRPAAGSAAIDVVDGDRRVRAGDQCEVLAESMR